jgi:hypothetical protein
LTTYKSNLDEAVENKKDNYCAFNREMK